MPIFVICYDLQAPRKDYTRIREGVEALSSTRCRVLESTWIIEHEGPIQTIQEHIRSHVDANDTFFVFEIIDFASFNDNLNSNPVLKAKMLLGHIKRITEHAKESSAVGQKPGTDAQ